MSLGLSHENADFMTAIGVPEEFDDFLFYELNDLKKLLVAELLRYKWRLLKKFSIA
ncbi:hypothetical protein [Paenibacillus polymyxa]|uniref:hypothetical protein n=1 Tax=Paenibacillus polymyxa TaxID=1406 RepID=UPI00287F98BF|nr:hypothetical protein [Paenibacillus polymyxa]